MEQIRVPCSEFVEQVTDYLEGTMDPQVRVAVDHHLTLCPGCRDYLDQIRATIDQLGQIEDDALSSQAWDELQAAFRSLD